MGDYAKTEKQLDECCDFISNKIPGYGFAILVFDLENPGITSYASNCERVDMIKALKETAKRFENNEVIGRVEGSG